LAGQKADSFTAWRGSRREGLALIRVYMTSETIQLSGVTEKALGFWLKKAKNEGLTAIQAACLAYDYEPALSR
jgi:predicted solute-binding protein